MTQRKAIIIGAGPAGLTAAVELLRKTDIKPVVLEMSDQVGGISRTENHEGNRIDIGGHRFFSRSQRVMQWWVDILPLEQGQENAFDLESPAPGPDPDTADDVMLIRTRKSRIYWNRKLFDYPLTLSGGTISKLGFMRLAKAGLSYFRSAMFPIKPEKSLEDFFINRFGRELYNTFFKSYTEKVWGVPCSEIAADWGAQRIKGFSVFKAIAHALTSKFKLNQKQVETTLISQFMYPKFGPGHLWQKVADEIINRGGEIIFGQEVVKLETSDNKISGVVAKDITTGQQTKFEGDVVLSSMPVKGLVDSLDAEVPAECKTIADGLAYRDFFTVGLLVDKLKLKEKDSSAITDNWIYIQEPDVQVGRLQIFNNWSPYMVADDTKIWIGMEYFCQDSDDIWSRDNDKLINFAADELTRIGIIERDDVHFGCVIRTPKAYPAYFGTYDRFDTLREYLDTIENLFLVGRNGMHRYNNMDHSMLAAMTAVENIAAGKNEHQNIWAVNTEQDYHEQK